jgi:hypothetical protein
VNGQATMQQAARGSSVLVDNARWSAFLAPMTEQDARSFGLPAAERVNYVRWNISKQNYGAALADVWYRRDEGGVLVPVKFTASRAAAPGHTAPAANENETVAAAPVNHEPPTLPSAKGAFGGQW